MADVFISYAHRDQERGLAIGRILTELGWDIWQDVNKLRPMEEFTEEIAAGIRECSVFLMLYSNAYHHSPGRTHPVGVYRARGFLFTMQR